MSLKNYFPDQTPQSLRNFVLVISALLLTLHVVYAVVMVNALGLAGAGNLGDTFGGLSALTNSISVLFIILTLNLQQKQLQHAEMVAAKDLRLRHLLIRVEISLREMSYLQPTDPRYHEAKATLDAVTAQLLANSKL